MKTDNGKKGDSDDIASALLRLDKGELHLTVLVLFLHV